MPIDPKREAAIRAEAKRRGVDPDEAVKLAEDDEPATAAPAKTEDPAGDKPAPDGVPTFERMLIGAFSFVTVRELRQVWLKQTGPFPDDDLPCGVWQLKHEGGGAKPPTDPSATE